MTFKEAEANLYRAQMEYLDNVGVQEYWELVAKARRDWKKAKNEDNNSCKPACDKK